MQLKLHSSHLFDSFCLSPLITVLQTPDWDGGCISTPLCVGLFETEEALFVDKDSFETSSTAKSVLRAMSNVAHNKKLPMTLTHLIPLTRLLILLNILQQIPQIHNLLTIVVSDV